MKVQVFYYNRSHLKFIKSYWNKAYYLLICCLRREAHMAPVIEGNEYSISASRMSINVSNADPKPSRVETYEIDQLFVNKWLIEWQAASLEYPPQGIPQGLYHWIRYALSLWVKYPNCITWTNKLVMKEKCNGQCH